MLEDTSKGGAQVRRGRKLRRDAWVAPRWLFCVCGRRERNIPTAHMCSNFSPSVQSPVGLGFHQVPLSAETARPFVHVQLCLRGEVPVRTSGLADAKRSF